MPGSMPADIAERLSDVAPLPITAALLDQAREEMIERLLEGKQVGHMTFADILDADIDAGRVPVADIAGHLLAINDYAQDEHTHVERRRNLDRWLRPIVERWVDSHPEKVRERAEEMLADEGDDA